MYCRSRVASAFADIAQIGLKVQIVCNKNV